MQVRQEARLPQPRHSGDEHRAPPPFARCVPPGEQSAELRLAADQFGGESRGIVSAIDPTAGSTIAATVRAAASPRLLRLLHHCARRAQRGACGVVRLKIIPREQRLQVLRLGDARHLIARRHEALEQEPPGRELKWGFIARAPRNLHRGGELAGAERLPREGVAAADEDRTEAPALDIGPLLKLRRPRRREVGNQRPRILSDRVLQLLIAHSGEKAIAIGIHFGDELQKVVGGGEPGPQPPADVPDRLPEVLASLLGGALGPEEGGEAFAGGAPARGGGEVGEERDRFAATEMAGAIVGGGGGGEGAQQGEGVRHSGHNWEVGGRRQCGVRRCGAESRGARAG